jgi:ATP-binding cassette subfamily B protein
MTPFPLYKQLNSMDCGPTCLRMIAKYYGRHYNGNTIRELAGFNKEGVSLLGISEAAEKIGFRTRAVQLTYKQLTREALLPCILHWDHNHFVVLPPPPRLPWQRRKVVIADPGRGRLSYTNKEFIKGWITSISEEGDSVGTAMLLEPTPRFYEEKGEAQIKLSWTLLYRYLRQSRWQLMHVTIALLIGSLLQLVFPLLTESIVDIGIDTHNLPFIVIVLIAQLMLTFSRSAVDFIRTRLLLRVSIVRLLDKTNAPSPQLFR